MARLAKSEEFWLWDHVLTSMGAISAGVSILGATKVDAAREQGWRGSKIRYDVVWGGKTINEGPIVYGLAWALSAAEVSECQDADPQGDVEVQMEVVRRNLLPLGIIPKRSTQSGELAGTFRYPVGSSFRTKKLPSWDIREQSALTWFFHVPVTGVALTTGTIIEHTFGLKGGWLND